MSEVIAITAAALFRQFFAQTTPVYLSGGSMSTALEGWRDCRGANASVRVGIHLRSSIIPMRRSLRLEGPLNALRDDLGSDVRMMREVLISLDGNNGRI